jgi:hypothetical protein
MKNENTYEARPESITRDVHPEERHTGNYQRHLRFQ